MLRRFILTCFLISLFAFAYCKEREIILRAQQENLPIAAIFLGGKQCPWSQKLIQDILESPLFNKKLVNRFLLWKITPQDQAIWQKYRVEEYPQILLLDPKGKEFARLSYLPLDAAGYADKITCIIANFEEICFAMEEKEGAFLEERWADLYLKAKQLSVPDFAKGILERGLKKEKGTFFHLEKFAAVLEKSKLEDSQVLKMKKDILRRDPKNQWGTHFKVAVFEFQKIASQLKPKDRFEKALKPLFEYVDRFGPKDADNLWRAELVIAEFLFEKNQIPLSLEHAKIACLAAPEAARPQILEIISRLSARK